jgi:hypothetical protein
MKRNKFVVLFAVVALMLASLACNALSGNGISLTTANITNAHMASDVDDTNQTTVFSPSDPTFYCFFDLNNAPDSTVVKSVWTAVSAEGVDPNFEIDSAEVTGGDNNYYFNLDRSADLWPVGQYKVDLYIDAKLVQTLTFEVK